MDVDCERTADAPRSFVDPRPTLPTAPRLGRYAVVRHLGSGGMGSVHVAYDEELHRRVAIKLLHDVGEGEHARERLLREAQALARVSHPNVVQIHDIGEHDGQIFMAMEYVEGLTLRAWQDAARPGVDAVREAYLQAGRGLAAAHAAGLAHRDFKADNAVIGADGRVRVLDFGLARLDASPMSPGPEDLYSTLIRAGALVGTPAYMSPEQFVGATADARSDQFSFCIALHEAFYGERPFAGETVAEIDAAVTAGVVRPPPPDVEVPPRLHRALLRGLARDPAARWPTMDDLLRELAVDSQSDPSGSPRLRQRLIVAWIVVFALIQLVVLGAGLATGEETTAGYHWIEGLFVWALFAAAWLALRGPLRAHAHHRAVFDTFMIAVTAMAITRPVLYLSGAPLAAMIAADLILVGTATAVGAMFVARWMLAVSAVCAALAVLVAVRPDAAARHMLAVYSGLNLTFLAGWALSTRPRRDVSRDPAPRDQSVRGSPLR